MNDIIVGLQHGDEGKGKVTKYYVRVEDYDYCVRFNGGPNAGHTVYHNGKKFITHQIPSGIFYNIKCMIGTGCVIDLEKLQDEIEKLEEAGINVRDNLKISRFAHVITQQHIMEDERTDKIGSTKSGIRPVYRDKYNRRGFRMDIIHNDFGCEIVDPYVELKKATRILFEGAQGFELDIDSKNYPYVTSSHCLAGHVNTTGVSIKTIRDIIGVAKIYDTYVGLRNFQGTDPDLEGLGELGEEVGSTTGRERQCNWLNLDKLTRAIDINGVNVLIINKCDIIKKLGKFKLYHNYKLVSFDTFEEMRRYIEMSLKDEITIRFSESKNAI